MNVPRELTWLGNGSVLLIAGHCLVPVLAGLCTQHPRASRLEKFTTVRVGPESFKLGSFCASLLGKY